jgi:hypothetical protein
MASPVGGEWRGSNTGPEWGHIIRRITVLQAGVESHESSYEPTHYATLTDSLQDAIDALNAAASADQNSANNSYPL